MTEHIAPVQSLIDHIKTAVDVDPWAKEMAEELLKKQEPLLADNIFGTFASGTGKCPTCGNGLYYANIPGQKTMRYCDQCGQAVKWSMYE